MLNQNRHSTPRVVKRQALFEEDGAEEERRAGIGLGLMIIREIF